MDRLLEAEHQEAKGQGTPFDTSSQLQGGNQPLTPQGRQAFGHRHIRIVATVLTGA
jgi:hypothetical protein